MGEEPGNFEANAPGARLAVERLDVAAGAGALATLWVRSWQEVFPAIDFEARRGWILAFLAGEGLVTFVAGERRSPQGFVTIEPGRAYLHQLVAAPEAKGGGVARALLAAAKAALPGGMTLDVNKDNVRAVRFYEREGFVTAGEGGNEGSGLATWRMTWASRRM